MRYAYTSGYVRQGADADGAIVSAWLFDPDGTVLEGPNGPVSHLICGGVYDWSTGLIYRGGRYFDPNLGIWLALTPLLVVQGWRKRKDKRQWVLLVCVGLCVVGMLAGCGNPPAGQPTLTVCPTPTPIPGLGPGTGTPTPTPIPPTPSPTASPTPTPEPGVPPYTGPQPNPGPCPCSTPEGWEWKLATDKEPGLPFFITHYNTTVESRHPVQEGMGLELEGVNLSRQVSQSFREQVRMQGSGYLDLGNGTDYNGYINYTVGTGTFRRTSCPEAANGCAKELQTGATSQRFSDREATKIEIFGNSPAGDRTGTLICIETLNKEILVNDTGTDVGKYQIDVYTGLEGGSADVGFPGNHYSMVWRLERKG